MAEEKNLTVDMEGFKNNLEEQKNRSRKAAEKSSGDWVVVVEDDKATEFKGYNELTTTSKIMRYREVVAKNKKHYEIVLDATPFYAEMGGQVGDIGTLTSEDEVLKVLNTVKENDLIIHITDKIPTNPEAEFTAVVDVKRRKKIEANHTTTHLMHAALRQVLGNHVEQKGSLVNDERLRFDFSHFAKMTDEEIKEVERIVNEKIREDILNNTYENVPIEEAKNMGAMALFGEKYGDHVRVVAFDKEYSVELCGGTHIASTGRIGAFKILSEGAIAAGVRRIEAVTGEEVMNYLDHQIEQISKIKEIVKTSGDLIKAIENLNAQNQTLQKKVEQMMHDKAVAEARSIYNTAVDYEGRKLIVAKVEADVNQMRTIATSVKELDAEAILIMGGIFEAKPALCVMIPQSLVDERKWDAGTMIREAAKEIQGGGGGQKTLATAGGKNVDGIEKAINVLKNFLSL